MKQHIPILVQEILSFVPAGSKHIADGTFGHGWHSKAFIAHYLEHGLAPHLLLTCCDRDSQVLDRGKDFLQQEFPQMDERITIDFIADSYANLNSHLPNPIDFVLLDLGINREHVTDNSRWFSFQGDGPLDMRFDPRSGMNAYDYIQNSSEQTLSNHLQVYGDFSEKRAHHFAQHLTSNKTDPRLRSTLGLKEILVEGKLSFWELAPFFQSLRIAVNNEFWHIDTFMQHLGSILAPGGRCAIISFHSIEDRLIKNHFKNLANDWGYRILTKHVIKPSWQEIKSNKASRSAKLRVIEKL